MQSTTVLSGRIAYSHLLCGEMPTRRAPKRFSEGGSGIERLRSVGMPEVSDRRSWNNRTDVSVEATMKRPSSEIEAD